MESGEDVSGVRGGSRWSQEGGVRDRCMCVESGEDVSGVRDRCVHVCVRVCVCVCVCVGCGMGWWKMLQMLRSVSSQNSVQLEG